ncbi:MAG: Hcp family type VI secretion system effector [Gaiellaceae bacterium]
MAVDYFLKIDGIDGESADSKHKGEIELASFSWGVAQSGQPARGGGRGAGKVQFQDFHFVARTTKASPKLFLACASGQHVKSALLTCRRAGRNRLEFFKYKLSEVLVSSFVSGGSTPEEPLDQVSLNFAKVEMEYASQGKAGKAGGSVKAAWDLKANKKI